MLKAKLRNMKMTGADRWPEPVSGPDDWGGAVR
jgi:hypothetical protein